MCHHDVPDTSRGTWSERGREGVSSEGVNGCSEEEAGKKRAFQPSRSQTCLKNLLFLLTLDTKFILLLYQVNTREITFQITKEQKENRSGKLVNRGEEKNETLMSPSEKLVIGKGKENREERDGCGED